jgi:two-component system, chemotaxis family, sensor kinase CheA
VIHNTAHAPELRRKRILLVEDNPLDRDIFFTALNHAGYDVIQAEDGSTGLLQALESNPDVVVLDLMLPGMSGWDIATVLRGMKRLQKLKLLVVSAHTERRKDPDRSLMPIVDGYLTKPIEPRTLVEQVRKLIGT